jgi:tetratricopeptide (TPR) repeat protein
MRRCLLLILALSACAHPKPGPPPDLHSARLAAADAQVRAGCLDCLVAAYREYEALRSMPPAAVRATAGVVRSAALIALRERELGMVDEGYLQRARDAAAAMPDAAAPLVGLLDVIDATAAASVGAGRPTSDVDLERMRINREKRVVWTDMLREAAGTELAAAYTWMSFVCGSSDIRNTLSRDAILTPAAPFSDAPIVQYRTALCAMPQPPGSPPRQDPFDQEKLAALQTAEPRFHEIDNARGQSLLARRKLDDADVAFEQARLWHPAWPTLTLAIANVAMTAEEFERALAMYEETLKYEPKAVDALLGKVKTLTYLGQHEEAIATVDVLIAERWYVGDGRYWRALNETQLERYDQAWEDIELANKLLLNAEVPKLAGIIAYRRTERDVSKMKFDLSRTRNPKDCETGHYLGLVLAELKDWTRTAEVSTATAQCLQTAVEEWRKEIASIQASDDPPQRKQRKIAKREQSIVTAGRWTITSWFNTAVAYYNLARPSDARAFAEKVVDDEQFGERARELVALLQKSK